MKNVIFEISTNKKIAKDVYEMTLLGNTAGIRPGTFVNIKLDGLYLRRPISVCNIDGNVLTLVYKAVGVGTEKMAAMCEGEKLDVLTQLGNGYNLDNAGDNPVLIGGGVGVPPTYLAARLLKEKGKNVTVIMGFNTSDEIFYEEEFKALGVQLRIATVDGGVGTKGFVTDALEGLEPSYIYTCGPEPMLKAVYNATSCSGEYSFEERMGCGFGACMGCSCKTKYGNKRICKEGPVLVKEEIIW